MCVHARVGVLNGWLSTVLRVGTVMWLSGMHGNRYRAPLWASAWQKQLIWWISRNCSVSVCQSLLNVRRLISVEGCSRSCWAGNMSSCVVGCIAGCQALSGVCVCVCNHIYFHFYLLISAWASVSVWLVAVCLRVPVCMSVFMCVWPPLSAPFLLLTPPLGRSPVPAVLIISVWRWLAQFSRNRGLFSFPHSLSLTHTQTHTL